MLDGNELMLRHILATIDGKPSGARRFNGQIGKLFQDFEFSRLEANTLLYVTWEEKSCILVFLLLPAYGFIPLKLVLRGKFSSQFLSEELLTDVQLSKLSLLN